MQFRTIVEDIWKFALPRGWGSAEKPTSAHATAAATSNSQACAGSGRCGRPLRLGNVRAGFLARSSLQTPRPSNSVENSQKARPHHPPWRLGVRHRREGARTWPAGTFTCCVQKRVVDIRFGAAAGFLVAGAGDLPGGGSRGHAPAILRWLLRVSIEQSWTRTRSAGPGSASDSPGSLIPSHRQPRTGPTRAESLATSLPPAASPRPCPPFPPQRATTHRTACFRCRR